MEIHAGQQILNQVDVRRVELFVGPGALYFDVAVGDLGDGLQWCRNI